MKAPIKILIADRNPHVRGLLKRELTAEGFNAITIDSWHDVLKYVFGPVSIDILVIDPSLPDMDDAKALMKKICNRIPPLPFILHSLPGDDQAATGCSNETVFRVEKGAESVEQVKKIIHSVLDVPETKRCNARSDLSAHIIVINSTTMEKP